MNDNSNKTRSWHFRQMQKSEMNYDPIQGEFFNNQDIADRLVRESLQNSLDALLDENKPVEVRFALKTGNRDSLRPHRAEHYFRGLGPHIQATLESNAPGRGVLDSLDGSSTVPYILIEDFNTKGLTGDIEQYTDQGEDQTSDDNHFYWFVRNVGRSGKRGLEGGSWGVGKWVFPDASAINTFFFLTHRMDESQTLLMGQSVLKMHMLDEARHEAYGYFADIEDGTWFAKPIQGQSEIQHFSKDFDLTRDGEPGLSIAIPFPEDGLDRNTILRAVVRYYFSPILSGKLVVRVADAEGELRVDFDTIYGVIDRIDWHNTDDLSIDDRRRMFDLVQEHATIAKQQRILSLEPEAHQNPNRTHMNDRFNPDQLEVAKTRFEDGKTLAFRIFLWVHPKGKLPQRSWLDLILQRDNNFKGTHAEYVRNHLTIPEAGLGRLGMASNLRSLLIVDDDHLAALLRDSEEPSHSQWKERAGRVRDKYDLGASTVRFVNHTVRGITQILTAAQEGVHKDLLKDYFSIEDEGKRKNKPNGPTPRSPSPFEVSTRSGGFNIRVKEGGGEVPKRMRIQTAYNTRRGNPVTRYDPRDFRLDDAESFTIDVEKCTVELIERNEIIVNVVEADANVTVSGFDPNRDLLVQVDATESEQ